MTARTATRVLRFVAALALTATLAPRSAQAQFATTNVQLLWGVSGFKEQILEYNTENGQMVTLTLNHFSTWKYGDNFAFVDMYRGDFTGTTKQSTLYAEWHPRLFVNKMLGTEGNTLGIFQNWGIAAEVNQGPSFWAYMAGLGTDFALPFPGSISLNVYYRKDSFQPGSGANITNSTWQVSPSWVIPFSLGKTGWIFTGFVDVYAPKDFGGKTTWDLMTQPELMVDVGALGGAKNALYLGVEWYLHYNAGLDKDNLVSAPQVMLQWNLH